jgi:transcriptional regulator with XRE-family HTH domain
MTSLKKINNNENLLRAISYLQLNITMGDLGSKLGYTKSTVSKYINGSLPPSDNFLKTFQEVFSIDLNKFSEYKPQAEIRSYNDCLNNNISNLKTDKNNEILKKAVASLNLRFENAEIARATKENNGNISNFLNNKKPVSDAFLKTFSEAFKIDLREFGYTKGLTKITPEPTPQPTGDLKDKMIEILENALKTCQAENERLLKRLEKYEN